MIDMSILALFTLELVYYLSVDHTACAVLAGVRIVGLLAWIYVTKRRAPGTTVDTSSHVAPVVPLTQRKKRF